MSSTTQRRIKPIQDHVDSGNWKQALQLCQKYEKKGEKSEAFLAIKALVLANQADPKQQKQGRDSLLQLCEQNPPITDWDTIQVLEDALANLNLGAKNSVRLWERAASASPGDKELIEKWLSRAVADLNWSSAQKAAMMLRKSFPKERQYEFWAIFMCYQINKDTSNDQRLRTLFGTMAYKMLAKAASDTPVITDEKAHITPGKAIHTPDELQLLVSVYTDLGYNGEALQLLQSDSLGVQSRVAKQDPLVFRDLLLALISRSENYDDTARTCHQLLGLEASEKTEPAADSNELYTENYCTWEVLINATMHCEQPKSSLHLQSLIEKYRSQNPKSRQASKAYLDLLRRRAQLGHDVNECLLETCKEIYSATYDKPTCFDDISAGVECLNPKAFESLYEVLVEVIKTQPDGSNPKISIAQANRLHMDYAFRTSISEDRKLCYDLIHESLSLSEKWAKGDIEPSASEVQILTTAVMCLIRLAGFGSESQGAESKQNPLYLIYAILLVRFMWTRSPTYYEVSLLYVQLSQSLGLGSIALTRAQDLNIKSLQWDTFAHNILSRISTIHPHNPYGARASDNTYMSPAVALDSAHDIYRRAKETRAKAVMQGLNYNSYRNTDSTIDFSNDLTSSICRKIYYLEDRRLGRLTGLDNYDFESFSDSARTVDKRKFDYFPNQEAPGRPLLIERLRSGNLPSIEWVNVMLVCDAIWEVLSAGSNPNLLNDMEAVNELWSRILKAQSILSQEQSKTSAFTFAEINMVTIQLRVGMAALSYIASRAGHKLQNSLESDANETNDSHQSFSKSIDIVTSHLSEILTSGKEWLVTHSPPSTIWKLPTSAGGNDKDIPLPPWTYFHLCFTTLDALKHVSQLLTFLDLAQKSPSTQQAETKSTTSNVKPVTLTKESRQSLTSSLTKVQELINSHAKEWRMKLSRQGVLGDIMDSILLADESGDENAAMDKKLAEAIEKILGTSEIETGVGEMRESWEEGLERVIVASSVGGGVLGKVK